MALDTVTPRSRRALLTAGLGGVAATIAAALGRPAPVRAGLDGDVVLAGTNTAIYPTEIENTTNGYDVLYCYNSLWGTGVWGRSGSGVGVYGESDSPLGVEGASASAIGVYGHNSATDQPAVRGWALGWATGAYGYSGTADPPATPAKTGVYGYAAQDSTAKGVYGRSTAGRGVFGYATSGTAGYFTTGAPTSGTALRAVGRVHFDHCAGVATISAGTKSVLVSPGIDLTAGSAVVATLMGSAGGTTTVHRVALDTVADTFRIYLTASSTATVKVAWHVFG